VKANDVVKFTVEFQNFGSLKWPSKSYLYELSGLRGPIEVEDCNVGESKSIDLYLTSPSKKGNYSYQFRMGAIPEGLFGDILTLTLIVTSPPSDLKPVPSPAKE
jgi:Ig-like domain from next to BRCA1 gene